jgi:hypothetical protein
MDALVSTLSMTEMAVVPLRVSSKAAACMSALTRACAAAMAASAASSLTPLQGPPPPRVRASCGGAKCAHSDAVSQRFSA